MDVRDIAVAGSGHAEIVFDVQVAASTTAGTVIANTASIANPGGNGATPSAPDLTVTAPPGGG